MGQMAAATMNLAFGRKSLAARASSIFAGIKMKTRTQEFAGIFKFFVHKNRTHTEHLAAQAHIVSINANLTFFLTYTVILKSGCYTFQLQSHFIGKNFLLERLIF
jgi:hypothetical protein